MQSKAGRLVRDLFLVFWKALYEVKASGLHLNLAYNKNKL